ncbi:MAG: DUF2934 domain-containing protein [Bryobacteraceae bacterium]
MVLVSLGPMAPQMSNGSETVKTASTVSPTSPTESEIARVAYRLWLERGSPFGSDREDWFRAEAMLKNALVATGEDLLGRPSIPGCDTRSESEMVVEFISEEWQGHWEVWDREWHGARWVRDLRDSGAGVSNRACPSSKAA